jgi:hypothetical protein
MASFLENELYILSYCPIALQTYDLMIGGESFKFLRCVTRRSPATFYITSSLSWRIWCVSCLASCPYDALHLFLFFWVWSSVSENRNAFQSKCITRFLQLRWESDPPWFTHLCSHIGGVPLRKAPPPQFKMMSEVIAQPPVRPFQRFRTNYASTLLLISPKQPPPPPSPSLFFWPQSS